MFAILASGINSHEAALRRAHNDERVHARAHLDVPLSREETRECDLEIARHKAGKGARIRLASPRGYEPSSICLPGPMPAICRSCTTTLYAAHRHCIASTCHAEPNGPFVFISVQRTNPPPRFCPCYRDRLHSRASLSFSLSLSLQLGIPDISSASPLSPKPATLFSFLHFRQARERHFDISAFSRRRVRPRERTAVTSAVLLFSAACGRTLRDCDRH